MPMLLYYREDLVRSVIWPSYDMVDVVEWFPARLVVVVIGLLDSTVLSSGIGSQQLEWQWPRSACLLVRESCKARYGCRLLANADKQRSSGLSRVTVFS